MPKPDASRRNGARSGGRPRKSAAEKQRDKYGKVTVRIDPATQMIINAAPEQQMQLIRLMLHFPEVKTVLDLPMYLVERLVQPSHTITLPAELLIPAVPWIEQALAQCFNPAARAALETLLAAIRAAQDEQ